MNRHRLAIVTSHPIQYQAPWFRALARVTDLEVFFCHRQDAAGQAAAGFGVQFDWDVPLLEGYRFTWLENRARRPDVSRFSGCHTPGIAAALRRGAFDACIVSGWYLRSYLQAIGACKRAGIPVMVRGDSHLGTKRSGVRTAMKYVPYRALMSAIDAHLYVGRANREYLLHYGVAEERLFFAPHFVDNEFFASRADLARRSGAVERLRLELDVSRDVAVFAFAGKLIDRKRPADFVLAIDRARRAGAAVCGIVVGSGPLQPELEALVRDRGAPVRFLGFRNQTELPACLAAADALVLPSDGRETWGLIVNEAMACGLPAVVSDACGCARDLVEDGSTGFRFPVGDVAALADALAAMSVLLAARRQQVRQAVLEKIDSYSCGAAVAGTLDALDRVAGAPRRGRVTRSAVAAPPAG